MKALDFIETAKDLIPESTGAPRRSNLRRALSTAYYVLFHCLARSCADMLIGGESADRSNRAWIQVYRALEHGNARTRCQDNEAIDQFPPAIKEFAALFASMQQRRHLADYAPQQTFYKSEVAQTIEQAKLIIAQFQQAPTKDRRAFAAHVLFKQRRG